MGPWKASVCPLEGRGVAIVDRSPLVVVIITVMQIQRRSHAAQAGGVPRPAWRGDSARPDDAAGPLAWPAPEGNFASQDFDVFPRNSCGSSAEILRRLSFSHFKMAKHYCGDLRRRRIRAKTAENIKILAREVPYAPRSLASPWLPSGASGVRTLALLRMSFRKGTNGVSTNGVTANFMFLDRGTFWALPLTYIFIIPKVPGCTFFPKLSKFITFAAAPFVLTPLVRNQNSLAQGSESREQIVHVLLRIVSI